MNKAKELIRKFGEGQEDLCRFPVGSRVKIMNYADTYTGWVGTVVEWLPQFNSYRVKFKNGSVDDYDEADLDKWGN